MFKIFVTITGILLMSSACCKPKIVEKTVYKNIYLKEDIPNLTRLPKLTDDEKKIITELTKTIVGSMKCGIAKKYHVKCNDLKKIYILCDYDRFTDIGFDIISVLAKFKTISKSIENYNKYYNERNNSKTTKYYKTQ